MIEIYSKVQTDMLLHIITSPEREPFERVDYTDDSEFLQVAKHSRNVGQNAKPHEHIENVRTVSCTHEAWVVISGIMNVKLFDTDRTLLTEWLLRPGECLITLGGGHSLEVVENVVFYEFKNGPYLGQAKDKVFFEGLG